MGEHRRVVIVAHELYPGLTVQLDRDQLAGLISEEGTRTSHAAILANSMGIPCVMGVPGAVQRIANGSMVLLDGISGAVLIEPTVEELEVANLQAIRRRKLELQLEMVVEQPGVTPDGREVTLMGNVDVPEEIDIAVRHGAQGVGLLRTEFLVTGRAHLPTESEQLEYFRRVSAAFVDRPVIIRTYDLGGDKFPAAFDAPSEPNPFLGWRSIRVCLDQPEIFRPQLRALLRAAADRTIWAMLPLITRVDEVERAREMLAEEAEDLQRAGTRAAATIPIGVMVETPAAVILADRLAEVSAFFSIGTNDLTQYTTAADRTNSAVAPLADGLDPAVLRLIDHVVRNAGVRVAVCGDLASDPQSAVLLAALGVQELSAVGPQVPLVKALLRQTDLTEVPTAAVLAARDAAEVRQLVRR
jgi:phosphoenolpyruvate-protein phosphotransferase